MNKQEFLREELKNYLNFKDKLKNDHPIKYWLLNTNIFIHLTFWLWALWALWVICSFLITTNNTKLIHTSYYTVIFESAFSYVYNIFNPNDGEKGSIKLSSTIWFLDAYSFLSLSTFLFFLTLYMFGVVKNFLFDLQNIFAAHKEEVLIKKHKNFVICFNLMIFVSLINIFWTTFSLLYVPKVSDANAIVETLLFAPKANSSKSYSLPFTNIGTLTFLFNVCAVILNSNLYYSFCYEKFNNNHFFFKETRAFLIVKENKALRKLNTGFKKKKFSFFKKKNFYSPNTEGYFAELKNVSKVFYVNNQPFFALNNITLKIKKGDFIVLLGPSGSGKTTLVNVLSGIDKPTKGTISISDSNTMEMNDYELNIFRRKNIGYVFQHFALLPNLTAWENVDIVNSFNRPKTKLFDKAMFKELMDKEDSWKKKIKSVVFWLANAIFVSKKCHHVDEILEIMNLSEHAHKYPHQLSGGQQQRVAIARSLIKRPKILFGDEITGALDSHTAKKILEIFYLINKYSKTTVILITHNPAIAEIADRVLYVKDGKIEKDVTNKNPKKIHELNNL